MLKRHLFSVFPAVCAVMAVQGVAFAGNGSALMKQIPDTTQIVIVFDVAEARDSPLVTANFQKMLDSNPDAGAKLAAFGIDPMKDLDTVMFAGGGVAELSTMKEVSKFVMIVEGRIPKKAMDNGTGTKSKHRGVEIFTKEDTDAAFVGKNLVFTRKGQMNAAIDVALGKAKNAATSPKAKALRTAIAATDTKTDVWVVVMVPDKDKTNMAQSGLLVDSIAITVKLASDLAAVMRLNAPNDAEAAKSVSLLQTVLPMLKQSMGGIGLAKAAGTLTLTQDKASVQVAGTVTEAELAALMAMANGAPPPTPPPAKPTGPVIPKTQGLGGATKPAPVPAPKP